MRTIKYTGRFKRDYKREIAGRHGKTLDVVLMAVVDLLATDATLPHRNFDSSAFRSMGRFSRLPSQTRLDSHLPKAGCRQPGTGAPRLSQRAWPLAE